MLDDRDIYELLRQTGILNATHIVRDSEDGSSIFVFVRADSDMNGTKPPSKHILRIAESKLSDLGIRSSFVVTGEGGADIQETIKSALMVNFPKLIRNVFSSLYLGKIRVWVEPKVSLTQSDASEIKRKCSDVLSVINMSLDEVKFTSAENVPSRTAFLRLIRLHSPLSIEMLAKHFIAQGFDVPSDEWLTRSLDSLRKAGLVMRLKDGGYVLTFDALQKLGSSKGRKSPDIIRALDLARRGR